MQDTKCQKLDVDFQIVYHQKFPIVYAFTKTGGLHVFLYFIKKQSEFDIGSLIYEFKYYILAITAVSSHIICEWTLNNV